MMEDEKDGAEDKIEPIIDAHLDDVQGGGGRLYAKQTKGMLNNDTLMAATGNDTIMGGSSSIDFVSSSGFPKTKR